MALAPIAFTGTKNFSLSVMQISSWVYSCWKNKAKPRIEYNVFQFTKLSNEHTTPLNTFFSSGVNWMMKTVSIPGATLCPTSWGLMILKYGESVWVTLTRRATYKVKKNTPQYLSLSLISYPVQFNQHLLKQTLHYTADIKSNPNQFKLCVNLIFPKVESPHSTKKLALHSSKSAQTYFIQCPYCRFPWSIPTFP